MNRKTLFIICCCIAGLNTNIMAFDLMIGGNASQKSVWVEEKSNNDNDIAKMSDGIQYAPTIGLRTNLKYFNNETNWGHFYQFDGVLFDISKQELPNIDKEQNVGTSIKGYSLSATPTAFYHFKKNNENNWSYKTGIGVGLGYLKLNGNFKITEYLHPEYNQIKQVDVAAIGFSVGVFFEASNNNHSIVIQNFAPSVSDNKYNYLQHNVDIMYRYKINF
ncbi:hypothetical protein HY745_10045 [Candidatus Desantisbacteria bacterium]|nr:hypothetical protein [Candidatus Desantisbacteria bacterium]